MKALLIELFDKYYKDVYTYLYGLSHDASLSEDLTQEVFLEVIKSIASFRGDSDIKTWLFSIARHRWYAYLRGKSRQIDADSIHDLHDANFINLSMDPFPSQLEEAIQVVVSEEPELTKQVFKMRLDGYSYFEIAAKHGISESSARVIFFRLKAKIKKFLEKEGF
ncbi:MAG: RNA polymerase sigma factor [Firmicutes bacterium]|nr:RNA polymerase sigma factor [Bacillota bacterium]